MVDCGHGPQTQRYTFEDPDTPHPPDIIIEMAKGYIAPAPDRPTDLLRAALWVAADAEAEVVNTVATLREEGVSWSDIADAAGLKTKQAAQHRWGQRLVDAAAENGWHRGRAHGQSRGLSPQRARRQSCR
jgi:hypothetical protein